MYDIIILVVTKLIFWSMGKTAKKKKKSVGRQNKNII